MRNKKRTSSKPLLVGGAVLLIIAVLVFLRFHISRLEGVLNGIDKEFERYAMEEINLKQEFSKFASPYKIYKNCKEGLGMDKAKHVEVVRVVPERFAFVPEPEPRKGWRSSIFAFFGFSVN
jgi:hypothetical protein